MSDSDASVSTGRPGQPGRAAIVAVIILLLLFAAGLLIVSLYSRNTKVSTGTDTTDFHQIRDVLDSSMKQATVSIDVGTLEIKSVPVNLGESPNAIDATLHIALHPSLKYQQFLAASAQNAKNQSKEEQKIRNDLRLEAD